MLCKFISNLTISSALYNNIRALTVSSIYLKERVVDRKEMLKSLPAMDEGTAGEKIGDVDSLANKYVLQVHLISLTV